MAEKRTYLGKCSEYANYLTDTGVIKTFINQTLKEKRTLRMQ
jgi:hypothetical protein